MVETFASVTESSVYPGVVHGTGVRVVYLFDWDRSDRQVLVPPGSRRRSGLLPRRHLLPPTLDCFPRPVYAVPTLLTPLACLFRFWSLL